MGITCTKLSPINDNVCCICLETVPDNIITRGDKKLYFNPACCKGIMHRKCCKEILKKKDPCPLCRGNIYTGEPEKEESPNASFFRTRHSTIETHLRSQTLLQESTVRDIVSMFLNMEYIDEDEIDEINITTEIVSRNNIGNNDEYITIENELIS